MKSYFFVLNILFFFFTTLTVSATTILQNYPYGIKTYNNRPILRRTYNPYSPYSSYTNYKRSNLNNKQRLKRLKKIRQINRIKNNISYYLSRLSFNNNRNGYMTGYSVPINQSIYSQIGIDPYNPYNNNQIKQVPKSITCDMDLYSMPSGNEYYYKDGRFYRDLSGVSGKTGVSVIYD